MSRLRELRKATANEKKKKQETSELEECARKLSLTTPVPVSCQNNPILTPVPISSTVFSKKVTHEVGSINFSDFESDTSSPFDNMELKTINDLEELAHVLGGLSTSSSTTTSTTDSHQQAELSGEDQLCGGPLPAPPNGLLPGECFSWPNPYCIRGSWLNRTMPLQSYVVQSVHSSPVVSLPSTASTSQAFDNGSSGSGGHPCASGHDTVPSIMQHLQSQLQERRALVQPKLQVTSPVVTNTNTGRDVECVRQKVNSENKPSTLPNPIASLSTQCQALANRVAEMGFPLARTARAVQLFGNDEAKVIEFLLQVQTLEDVNHVPGDRAEKALIANGYSEENTSSYLEKLKQLMDLGFREEQVIQALERFNSDRDKALDSLIS
ncbi:hypothetical protein AAG570_006855 [Ranatra chinensis]|uniref:UBA domain-containing protein n=1 Tax=Ranatra chinensis TaxID=642074 RepID=A0ABD0YV99_9HEMI